MDFEAYKKSKAALSEEYRIKGEDIDRQYAAANALCISRGDVIAAKHAAGDVADVRFGVPLRGSAPEMAYTVIAHTKKGVPRKDGLRLRLWQSDITHINGKEVQP